MAAITDRITVFVKPLFGDTLSLEIHPSYDLKDVADTLSCSDPITFPFGITIVSFIDEEQKEITDETMLAVLVQEPIESIVRVDTFDWKGNTAYRLRIQADRIRSMHWMPDEYLMPHRKEEFDLRRQSPQLFDICYYPADKTFMLPFGGLSLYNLEVSVGKRFKRPATALKGRDGRIVYRRDNVGFLEFDDDISRLPDEDKRIDWSEFILTDDAIQRISTILAKWISEQGF